MSNSPMISIVVPLLNEESNIAVLYSELKKALTGITDDYEILFVDDGSTDKSFIIIQKLNASDKRIRGISLSRNFGHQVALLAGMENADGELVVSMDADLQHPPEVIKNLYEKHKEGFDIVNTRRIDAKNIGLFKKTSSKYFYKIINALSDVRIEPASSDFRLMSRTAVDAFLKIQERDRFTRGLVSWMGFRQAIVEYHAPPRFAGKSKYTLRKMLRFSLDGITSFSAKPLRIAFYIGTLLSVAGLFYAVFAIIGYFRGETIQGWTSLMVTVLLIGGVQLVSIGIIGEYIARIFNESKARPVYFVKEMTK